MHIFLDIVILFLIPIAVLIGGFCMRFFPPKNPNGWIGYRTELSIKNQLTWKFAQRSCGNLWILLGSVFTILAAIYGILELWLPEKEWTSTAVIRYEVLQLFPVFASVLLIEQELKKNFDKDGNPINKE